MITERRVSGLLIVATLAVALLAQLSPLPAGLSLLRPAIFPAVILFWVLMQPGRFGLITAWFCGLLLDGVYGTPLGQHALAIAISGYAVVRLRAMLWSFPILQQALLFVPIFAVYEFMLFWIDGVTGASVDPLWRWLPVLTTALIWPLLAELLERIAASEVR